MTRLNFLALLLLGLLATLISATAHSTTKPPTVSKPVRTPKPRAVKPSRPTKAPKPAKPQKLKKCTKHVCEGSMRKASKQVGQGYKQCSNQTCPGLLAWKTAVAVAGFPLTSKYASLSTAATTPKTNCTADRAKVCTRILKNVRKTFQNAYNSACTNVTCPPLYNALNSLKGKVDNFKKTAPLGPPPVVAFAGCSPGQPDGYTSSTNPVDAEGKQNLGFENCLNLCTETQSTGMALAGQTQCYCYDYLPGPNEPTQETDGGEGDVGRCDLACFGDGDNKVESGCGGFFTGAAAIYSLTYPVVEPIPEETPAPSPAPTNV